MSQFQSQFGPWALVTGASSGIGAEFARQLAGRGLNVVTVARRKSLLDQQAATLQRNSGITVRPIALDLNEADAMDQLLRQTQELDIGLVVPNAGIETHGAFLKIPLDEQTQLLRLNCEVPLRMAHHFGQQLAKRGRGGILFVSSTFAFQAVPYFANYAASKAYILSLGEALHQELKTKGVVVTTVAPGLTATEMPKRLQMDVSKLPMKAMNVEPVVRSALKALEKRQALVIPGGMNKMMAFMAQRLMPRQTIVATFGNMNRKAMVSEKI